MRYHFILVGVLSKQTKGQCCMRVGRERMFTVLIGIACTHLVDTRWCSGKYANQSHDYINCLDHFDCYAHTLKDFSSDPFEVCISLLLIKALIPSWGSSTLLTVVSPRLQSHHTGALRVSTGEGSMFSPQ